MKAPTHMTFGLFLGIALKMPLDGGTTIPLLIGTTLPDIDFKFEPLIRHRTLTHSLLAVAGAFYLNIWFGLGVLSHILLDFLNYQKVQFLYPLPQKFSLKLMKTGGFGEILVFVSLGLIMYVKYFAYLKYVLFR